MANVETAQEISPSFQTEPPSRIAKVADCMDLNMSTTSIEPMAAEQIDEYMLRAPTARQLSVLRFLKEHADVHGYPPTLREIGAHFSISSTNGVTDHLRALERKGYVVKTDMQSRGLKITPAGVDLLGGNLPDSTISALAAQNHRMRGLLNRCATLLTEIAGPNAPLLQSIRKELER